jgi:CheY-like chemotaxis protein
MASPQYQYPEETLVFIDDDREILAMHKGFFESCGYRVLTASSGREGLDLIQSTLVEAVIVDYRMPGMDGGQVAREVRRRQPQMPIIMVSGQSIPAQAASVVDTFVPKGELQQLICAIQNLGASRPAPNSSARDAFTSSWLQTACNALTLKRALATTSMLIANVLYVFVSAEACLSKPFDPVYATLIPVVGIVSTYAYSLRAAAAQG